MWISLYSSRPSSSKLGESSSQSSCGKINYVQSFSLKAPEDGFTPGTQTRNMLDKVGLALRCTDILGITLLRVG